MSELDLINFLEWLDSSEEVKAWGHPAQTHEDTVRKYMDSQWVPPQPTRDGQL